MNLVEFRLEDSSRWHVLCVSSVPFTPAHFPSLLKKEGWFNLNEDVVCSRKWEEDSYFFKGNDGFSGVYVRQRDVKVYQSFSDSVDLVRSLIPFVQEADRRIYRFALLFHNYHMCG